MNKKGILIFILSLVISISALNFAYALPTINSAWLNDTDNFYSSWDNNNIIHIMVNVSNIDNGGSVAANFSRPGFEGI